jgi:proteasome lid subunit RPN8/RPN11
MKITRVAFDVVCASAIDAYPKEAIGLLLGSGFVEASFSFQVPKVRTRWEVKTDDDSELRPYEYFGDRIIGEWHTHPEDNPTATQTDKDELLVSNTPYIGDGFYMLIVSIHPITRKPHWSLRHKGYVVRGERVVREEVEIV